MKRDRTTRILEVVFIAAIVLTIFVVIRVFIL